MFIPIPTIIDPPTYHFSNPVPSGHRKIELGGGDLKRGGKHTAFDGIDAKAYREHEVQRDRHAEPIHAAFKLSIPFQSIPRGIASPTN